MAPTAAGDTVVTTVAPLMTAVPHATAGADIKNAGAVTLRTAGEAALRIAAAVVLETTTVVAPMTAAVQGVADDRRLGSRITRAASTLAQAQVDVGVDVGAAPPLTPELMSPGRT